MAPTRIWAIVVAGGDGRRFGSPKQFSILQGRLVVDWAVNAARSVAEEVVLVLPSAMTTDVRAQAGCRLVVAGGPTRAASVRAGLSVVPDDVEVVLVHDAARPLASPDLFARVVDAVMSGADAAIPAIGISDTIKRVHDGHVVETLDRSQLVAVQTPQGFRTEALRAAHDGESDATDDAALVEALGRRVVIVDGELENTKLTETTDLVLIEQVLMARHATMVEAD